MRRWTLREKWFCAHKSSHVSECVRRVYCVFLRESAARVFLIIDHISSLERARTTGTSPRAVPGRPCVPSPPDLLNCICRVVHGGCRARVQHRESEAETREGERTSGKQKVDPPDVQMEPAVLQRGVLQAKAACRSVQKNPRVDGAMYNTPIPLSTQGGGRARRGTARNHFTHHSRDVCGGPRKPYVLGAVTGLVLQKCVLPIVFISPPNEALHPFLPAPSKTSEEGKSGANQAQMAASGANGRCIPRSPSLPSLCSAAGHHVSPRNDVGAQRDAAGVQRR